jgi:hypothetical protein
LARKQSATPPTRSSTRTMAGNTQTQARLGEAGASECQASTLRRVWHAPGRSLSSVCKGKSYYSARVTTRATDQSPRRYIVEK